MTDLKPGIVLRSDLTGSWFFSTRYKIRDDGLLEAISKHPIENSDQLESTYQEVLALRIRVHELEDEKEQDAFEEAEAANRDEFLHGETKDDQ